MASALPEKIKEKAEEVAKGLLPNKSGDKYLITYQIFMDWKVAENIVPEDFSEEVFLAYFDELSGKYAPSSMWTFYSMLKATIRTNHNLDVEYPRVVTFLKKCALGFIPKQAKEFEPEDVARYLAEAPDKTCFDMKVILVFGIYGAMRADELTNVRMEDIKQQGDVYLVKIPKTKTYLPRSFTVEGEYAKIIKRYIAMRPKKTDSTRFFVKYYNGKCANQVMGRNKFLGAPKKIAEYLGLENPENYTGHSLRRTAAAEGGASLLGVKQLGGWQSDKIAQHYIENTLHNKRQIASYITRRIESTIVLQSNIVENAPKLVEPSSTIVKLQSNVVKDSPRDPMQTEPETVHEATSSMSVGARFADSDATRDAGRYVMNFKDCEVSITYK